MSEELKALLEKINEEGIKAAEEKAKEIEAQAKRHAAEIIEKASAEAKALIEEAKERIAKMEEGSKASLKQAGRDLLIALRKEINAMLDRVIASHVHKALTAEELVKIIEHLVKEYASHTKDDVIVHLSKEDLERVEKTFLDELRNAAKKGIILKAEDEIRGGFIISYDSGRSYYDFTDKALAQYLSTYVNPKLSQMLNEITA